MTIITTCLIDVDEDEKKNANINRGGMEKGVPFFNDDDGYVLFIQGEEGEGKGKGRS